MCMHAALPAVRPILLVNHPSLGIELLAALDSKTEGTETGVISVDAGIIAERASQLAANLASEPVLIAHLEQAGKLRQWVARLLMRLESGRLKEQVGHDADHCMSASCCQSPITLSCRLSMPCTSRFVQRQHDCCSSELLVCPCKLPDLP